MTLRRLLRIIKAALRPLAPGAMALALLAVPGDRAPADDDSMLRTPLVLDLDGNGVALTSMAAGVAFDLDDSLRPVRTAWVRSDWFLVLDRDGDGKIGSGAELFGSATPMPGGGTARNGFEALARYDENKDGIIDSRDPVFGKLRLWRDSNGDGISTPEEMVPLKGAGIAAIELTYESRRDVDQYGNVLGERGRFRRTDGTTGAVVDVYLRGERPKPPEVPRDPEPRELPGPVAYLR